MTADSAAIATETLTEAKRAIEAVLLVASDPTPEQLLAQLVELPSEVVGQLCRDLADEYGVEGRGFELRQVAGGWRFQTHPDLHPYVERYALEGIPNRLSSAALETLSIVAYKQPISRAQISAIRGVNVDAVLRTLEQRGYIAEFGRDDGPGQAILFGTTSFFLERLGLASIEELPSLGDFVPSAEVLEALEETLKIDPIDSTTVEATDEATLDGESDNDMSNGSSAANEAQPSDPSMESNGHEETVGNGSMGQEPGESDPADNETES